VSYPSSSNLSMCASSSQIPPNHKVRPNILWTPTWSVADDAHPLIFEVPSKVNPRQLSKPAHPSNQINPQGMETLKTPSSSGPKFCTPGMKPPDKFDGENSSKLRGFLQSCKLLFLNDPTVFSDDCKKVLYAASHLG
ncbi:uncharacterized protein VP01_10437g1, partial [Puccinia sorghi]